MPCPCSTLLKSRAFILAAGLLIPFAAYCASVLLAPAGDRCPAVSGTAPGSPCEPFHAAERVKPSAAASGASYREACRGPAGCPGVVAP